MRRTKPLATVAAAIAIAGAGGCGGSDGDARSTPPQRSAGPEALWGTEFAGDAVSGDQLEEAIAEPTDIRLTFTAERARGIGWQARCNSYGGTVRITPTRLELTEVSGTVIGCPGARQREDEALASLLESDPEWDLSGARLVLRSGNETLTLHETD